MKPILLNKNETEKGAALLREGKVVVFPTETVFGIGVIYDDEKSFNDLVVAKHRPPDKPFTLMCSSVQEATSCCDADDKVIKTMTEFLPGELTVLAKAKNNLPDWVSLGTGIIGIRVPDSRFVQELLSMVGKPCLVTSANISGKETVHSANEAIEVFGDSIAAAIEGETRSGVASTIVDLTDEEPRLIRQGSLSFATIEEYWRSL